MLFRYGFRLRFGLLRAICLSRRAVCYCRPVAFKPMGQEALREIVSHCVQPAWELDVRTHVSYLAALLRSALAPVARTIK